MTSSNIDKKIYSNELARKLNKHQKPVKVMIVEQLEPILNKIFSISNKKSNEKTYSDLNDIINLFPKADELITSIISNLIILDEIFDNVDYRRLNSSDEINIVKINKKDNLENIEIMKRIRKKVNDVKNIPVSDMFSI